MESQQTVTVDVLALPEMALVTRLTAASLRTLAGMLNTLADTLAQVEVAKVVLVNKALEVSLISLKISLVPLEKVVKERVEVMISVMMSLLI